MLIQVVLTIGISTDLEEREREDQEDEMKMYFTHQEERRIFMQIYVFCDDQRTQHHQIVTTLVQVTPQLQGMK